MGYIVPRSTVTSISTTNSTTTLTSTLTIQQSTLTISISQTGSTLYWHIGGLTPGGSFRVDEQTSQGFYEFFVYTASSNGTDSRAFKNGGGTPGDQILLTVTDTNTGGTASISFTIQPY